MFLKRYKDIIIAKFQSTRENNREVNRINNLLRTNQFAKEIVGNSRRLCHVYDNSEWHSIVLETLDLDLIYQNVDKTFKNRGDNDDEYSDYLVKELLRYFKRDFFKWCNKPECKRCGTDEFQNLTGIQRANNEESKFDCGSVEVYRCSHCNQEWRYPRYNDPIKLLETRTGRCGEWCNLFTLILKSFGLKARYVSNKEDHVWCEYYSPHLKRWVHVDSCEQSFDQPYIYSKNWNKSMSYCIAYDKDGVTDVSKRYILQNQLPRNLIDENDLQLVCSFLTRELRKNLDRDDIYKLWCRDEQERLEWTPQATHKTETITPADNEHKGRISGSAEWKAQRREDGS
ncbi:hypothetical protein KAFR_0E00750 [Kazachstania africana CBS 2517]|uniref:Peptide-N(4)-(N-acetyl-beta-glucosaminyl)asparagine amidase n=1 Tax=Kazachstania africana (strain ATCC 22294 / BCRC 22015 / CBS 2517 / CECT 1963 / NBRC 1671 / NRRL Y-8276) TaxID=1071382 RepID=H2AV29_KAZAF|nr:hypothetical protein KAFR_0E00750 [Kazachstania africana CBS 2517]CCF58229.1 hypothetical protein KAFR_0E00750 [Kazachstania africana CBS 2517]